MDNTRPPLAVRRALLIGGGTSDAEQVATRIGPGAQVICLAADRGAGEAIKQVLLSRTPEARVVVMRGDPALLVHKVAGPFDLIVDAHRGAESRRERLRALAGETGEIYG